MEPKCATSKNACGVFFRRWKTVLLLVALVNIAAIAEAAFSQQPVIQPSASSPVAAATQPQTAEQTAAPSVPPADAAKVDAETAVVEAPIPLSDLHLQLLERLTKLRDGSDCEVVKAAIGRLMLRTAEEVDKMYEQKGVEG